MDIQSMVDAMGESDRFTRGNYHLTLGQLIEFLEKTEYELDHPVVFDDTDESPSTDPHSYRGYYSDLSFASVEESVPALHLLAACRGALGAYFTGYKGGEHLMDLRTPLWNAEYGELGKAIIGIDFDGNRFHLRTKEIA